jgi:hypothetical protein
MRVIINILRLFSVVFILSISTIIMSCVNNQGEQVSEPGVEKTKSDTVISNETTVRNIKIPEDKREYLFHSFWANMSRKEFQFIMDSLKRSPFFIKINENFYSYNILDEDKGIYAENSNMSPYGELFSSQSNIYGFFAEDKLIEIQIGYAIGIIGKYSEGFNSIKDNERLIYELIELYKRKYGKPTEISVFKEKSYYATPDGFHYNIMYKWLIVNKKIITITANSSYFLEFIDTKYQFSSSKQKPRLIPCSRIIIDYLYYPAYLKNIQKDLHIKDSLKKREKEREDAI